MPTSAATGSVASVSESNASSATSTGVPITAGASGLSEDKPHEDEAGHPIPVFWLLLSFRMLNAFVIRTFFQPGN